MSWGKERFLSENLHKRLFYYIFNVIQFLIHHYNTSLCVTSFTSSIREGTASFQNFVFPSFYFPSNVGTHWFDVDRPFRYSNCTIAESLAYKYVGGLHDTSMILSRFLHFSKLFVNLHLAPSQSGHVVYRFHLFLHSCRICFQAYRYPQPCPIHPLSNMLLTAKNLKYTKIIT